MKATQIQIAMDLAANLKASPAMFVDEQTAKDAIAALYGAIESSRCFKKAALNGHESFTLIPTDPLAPDTIDNWADRAQAAGVDPDKVGDARNIAARWRQGAHITRMPD